MPTKPTTREAIKRAISEFGPMTIQELAEELGKPVKTIGSCVSESRNTKAKHFYVKEWRPQVGISGLPSGVYALGKREDAPKPPTDLKASQARYYLRNKEKIKLRNKLKRMRRQRNPFMTLIQQVTT
jgi:hypothetical protein